MALSKEVKYDKIEVVGDYKAVQCRQLTVISEDGIEISKSFHRHVLHPDSDISSESQEVQAICKAVWTEKVKKAWTAKQEENNNQAGESSNEQEESSNG